MQCNATHCFWAVFYNPPLSPWELPTASDLYLFIGRGAPNWICTLHCFLLLLFTAMHCSVLLTVLQCIVTTVVCYQMHSPLKFNAMSWYCIAGTNTEFNCFQLRSINASLFQCYLHWFQSGRAVQIYVCVVFVVVVLVVIVFVVVVFIVDKII